MRERFQLPPPCRQPHSVFGGSRVARQYYHYDDDANDDDEDDDAGDDCVSDPYYCFVTMIPLSLPHLTG